MLPSFAQQSAKNKLQNRLNLINRTTLKLSSGSKQAEINIFHGKKGFSVVEIPKSGTDLELNSLSAELISLWLEYDYVT